MRITGVNVHTLILGHSKHAGNIVYFKCIYPVLVTCGEVPCYKVLV